jgi:hypothetical protein
LVKDFYSQADNVTKIALKTKDLNQCLALQNTCSNYKVDYRTLVNKKMGTLADNFKSATSVAVQAPKKVTDKPITKLSKEDTSTLTTCRKNLNSKVKSIVSFDYQIRKQSFGAGSFWSGNELKTIWAKITRPAKEANYINTNVKRVNNISICNNSLKEAQTIDGELSALVATGKKANSDYAANSGAFRKAVETWNSSFNKHKANIEKILDAS